MADDLDYAQARLAYSIIERLIEHINGHDGVRWATFDQIAEDFLQRSPRSGGRP